MSFNACLLYQRCLATLITLTKIKAKILTILLKRLPLFSPDQYLYYNVGSCRVSPQAYMYIKEMLV